MDIQDKFVDGEVFHSFDFKVVTKEKLGSDMFYLCKDSESDIYTVYKEDVSGVNIYSGKIVDIPDIEKTIDIVRRRTVPGTAGRQVETYTVTDTYIHRLNDFAKADHSEIHNIFDNYLKDCQPFNLRNSDENNNDLPKFVWVKKPKKTPSTKKGSGKKEVEAKAPTS